MKPQIQDVFNASKWYSFSLATTTAEPISKARAARKHPTIRRVGCLSTAGSSSNTWTMRRMMCKTTKTNAAVATKIKNPYSALKLPGELDTATNVMKVMIASTSLSHPSIVVTIHWKSQQRQLQRRPACCGSSILAEDGEATFPWWGRAGLETTFDSEFVPNVLPGVQA